MAQKVTECASSCQPPRKRDSQTERTPCVGWVHRVYIILIFNSEETLLGRNSYVLRPMSQKGTLEFRVFNFPRLLQAISKLMFATSATGPGLLALCHSASNVTLATLLRVNEEWF